MPEDFCKKYCVEEVKENFPSLKGYRILETYHNEKTDEEKSLGWLLTKVNSTDRIFLRTKAERYLSEFNICIIGISEDETIVLVDPSCPEYYFIDQEDLEEMLKAAIEKVKKTNQENSFALTNPMVDSTIEYYTTFPIWKTQGTGTGTTTIDTYTAGYYNVNSNDIATSIDNSFSWTINTNPDGTLSANTATSTSTNLC